MNLYVIAVPALLLALPGCDRGGATGEPRSERAAVNPPVRARVNEPVEAALRQIAPADRAGYQQAFACEVERNNARKGKAIAVTPEYVAALAARVKADPRVARC